MAFDGIVTTCMAEELTNNIVGGRVDKIFQPFRDEIVINIRAFSKNRMLLVSASSSTPRINFTTAKRENPSSAPLFCMILRKHLQGSKILSVECQDFERIITISFESMSELGDIATKKLIIEIMGRYSNIILTNENDVIIDSIKHVDNSTSRLREIMPARPYILPPPQDKLNPMEIDFDKLFNFDGRDMELNIQKYLLDKIKGFSPLICTEICFKADVPKNKKLSELSPSDIDAITLEIERVIIKIRNKEFSPCITLLNGTRHDFYCFDITCRETGERFDSISECIDNFYIDNIQSQTQKYNKADLIKVIQNNIDRCNKKISIHTDAIREAGNADTYRLYGELLTANIYQVPKNASSVKLINYYTNEPVEIPLNSAISVQKNMQKYYKKYNKAKTTLEYANKQLKIAIDDLNYFENLMQLLDLSNSIAEINEIREELISQNYIKQKRKKKGAKIPLSTKPLHFVSSDGFDIFVGKNNRQNDKLTLKTSRASDIWLHTKDIPGSHVIIKQNGKDIPQSTIIEAAIVAAYHSKAAISANVPVDYTEIRNVKKPTGAKPGMVIFENNRTIFVTPNKELVEKLEEK